MKALLIRGVKFIIRLIIAGVIIGIVAGIIYGGTYMISYLTGRYIADEYNFYNNIMKQDFILHWLL